MRDLIQKAHVKLTTFKRDEDGAAIVEYGVALLIVVGIGLAIFSDIGDSLNSIFGAVESELSDEVDTNPNL